MIGDLHCAEYVKSIYKINTLYTEQRITLTVIWNTHQMTRSEFTSAMGVWRNKWHEINPQWRIGNCSLSFNRQASYGKTVMELHPVYEGGAK